MRHRLGKEKIIKGLGNVAKTKNIIFLGVKFIISKKMVCIIFPIIPMGAMRT